jgi:archaellum component FlaC
MSQTTPELRRDLDQVRAWLVDYSEALAELYAQVEGLPGVVSTALEKLQTLDDQWKSSVDGIRVEALKKITQAAGDLSKQASSVSTVSKALTGEVGGLKDAILKEFHSIAVSKVESALSKVVRGAEELSNLTGSLSADLAAIKQAADTQADAIESLRKDSKSQMTVGFDHVEQLVQALSQDVNGKLSSAISEVSERVEQARKVILSDAATHHEQAATDHIALFNGVEQVSQAVEGARSAILMDVASHDDKVSAGLGGLGQAVGQVSQAVASARTDLLSDLSKQRGQLMTEMRGLDRRLRLTWWFIGISVLASSGLTVLLLRLLGNVGP